MLMTTATQIVFRSIDPSAEESPDVIAALTSAMRDHGLVHVAIAGPNGEPTPIINQEMIGDFYQQWLMTATRASSDPELARSWACPETGYQRGLTGPGLENNDASRQGASGNADDKWFYFANPTQTAGYEANPFFPGLMAKNFFPRDESELENLYMRLGSAMHMIARKVLVVLAQGLRIQTDLFCVLTDGGMHGTRAIYYPSLSADEVKQGAVWAANHTDCNMLTVLLGAYFVDMLGKVARGTPDGVAGLWQRTRTGERIYGTPPSEVWTPVQVGQQLEILTGGYFQATEHEVVPPSAGGLARMQMAHFCHMHPERMLHTLSHFVRGGVQTEERMRLAGQFMQATLQNIGLMQLDRMAELIRAQYASDRRLYLDSDLAWIPQMLEEQGAGALRDALIFQGHHRLHATTVA